MAQAQQEAGEERREERPSSIVDLALRKTAEKVGIDWSEIEPIIREVEEELGVEKIVGDIAKVMDFQHAIAREFSKTAGPATMMTNDAVTSEIIARAGGKVAAAIENLPVDPLERLYLKFTLPFAIAKVAEKIAGDGDAASALIQMLMEQYKGIVEMLARQIEELRKEREALLRKIEELERRIERRQRDEEVRRLEEEVKKLMEKLEELRRAAEESRRPEGGGEQRSPIDILKEAKRIEDEVRSLLESMGYKVEPATDAKKLEEAVKRAYEQGYKAALEKVGVEEKKIEILSRVVDRAIDFIFSLVRGGQDTASSYYGLYAPQPQPQTGAAIQELRERLDALPAGGGEDTRNTEDNGEEGGGKPVEEGAPIPAGDSGAREEGGQEDRGGS